MSDGSRGDLARELHDHRHDPDEWAEEAEPVRARPMGSSVVSFRMPTDEFYALQEVALASSESLSDYIREAVRMRRLGVRETVIRVTSSGGHVQVISTPPTLAAFQWSDAPRSMVPPDYPKRLAGAEAR